MKLDLRQAPNAPTKQEVLRTFGRCGLNSLLGEVEAEQGSPTRSLRKAILAQHVKVFTAFGHDVLRRWETDEHLRRRIATELCFGANIGLVLTAR